jgi:hypothetical protein
MVLGREISWSQWEGSTCIHQLFNVFLFEGVRGEGYFCKYALK